MKALTLSPAEKARAYLAAIPGAVCGTDGHDQTFAVARALVHGFALARQGLLPAIVFNRRLIEQQAAPSSKVTAAVR